MKIEIKERKLTEGKKGLYLEYYETGFRKRENLHLYLLPDDAVGAAKHNRLTYNKAMEIRAERILNPPMLEKENVKSDGQNNGLTWLQWCDDYIKWSVDCGNCKKMIGHKKVVRKRIATYLRRIDKKDILLKDVGKDEICGLFDYMRNNYRNKRQIKTNGGRLADYTLLLFEETIKAIFNKALREGLITFNPVHSLNKLERFHAPDKHREYLTPEELTRFLAVEAECENERTVQLAFGLSSMTALRLGDMQHLRWCDIKIIQRKTKRPAIIPLNEMAQSLLPPRTDDNPESLVFHLVKKSDNVSKYVRRLKEKAGIEKDLTYHCSSHSKFFYLLNISELSILKNVTANDLETSYILFLSQLCNIQRTL